MPKPYIPNDAWSRRAAKEGFRARSAYKLMEIDTRFALLHKGMTVLDLGAAPGSWLQYTSQKIGPKGNAIGVDLQPIAEIASNVTTVQCDIMDSNALDTALQRIGIGTVDLIVSDLAPSTSGIRDIDQWKSIELSRAVLQCAETYLEPESWCVMKILRGGDFDAFLSDLRTQWYTVKTMIATASRDRSREIYVLVRKKPSSHEPYHE